MRYKLVLLLVIPAIFIYAQSNTESDDFSYPLKLYNQQFYDLSAQQFVKFYTGHPSSDKVPEAKYYTGMSYYKLGEFNQARIEFQSAAIEYPDSKRAGENWYKTGECYLKLNNKTEAAKAFETIRLLYPKDPLAPEATYRAGVLYLETSNTDKAQQLFRVVIDRYNSSDQYFLAMAKTAELLFQIGELQKATDLLDKVLDTKIDPQALSEAYLLLGKINLSQGDFASAKVNFKKVLNEFSDSDVYTDAVYQLSLVLIQQSQYSEAQQYIQSGISKSKIPEFLQTLHALLGDVYFLDGKYALAQKEYSDIKDKSTDKDQLKLKLKYAFALSKQNLLNDAISTYSEALKDLPDDNEQMVDLLLSRYIIWLKKLNNPDKAIELINKQLDRFHSERIAIKLNVVLAEFLGKKNNWRGIIQKLSPFLLSTKNYPEKDDVLYNLAYAYEKSEKYEESADLYRQLIQEFGSSKYYNPASNRLSYLQNYKLIDKDEAVIKMSDLIGRMLAKENYSKLQFEHAKLYFSYFKNYNEAEKYFLNLLENNSERLGDIHLFLGKTYQMMAEKDNIPEKQANTFMEKAYDQYKLAVANISTCSSPDEASWCRVSSSMSVDTVQTEREKTIIEALIKNYPNSRFMEEWYKTLAYSLAFNEKYTPVAINYFKKLVDNYPDSPFYSYYLYGYAQLLQEKNHEEAIQIYKLIASEYPYSNEAANALAEVADYYASLNQYKEANILYNKLASTYYYSETAEENLKKLGQSYLRSGNFNEAINVILKQLVPFYLDDPVLSKEFLAEDQVDNIYFLASAYYGQLDNINALKYDQLYLVLAPGGAYVNNARFDIGKIYYDLNQKNVALENFIKISNVNENLLMQAQYYMAEIYFEQGRYDKAETIYSTLSKNKKGQEGAIDIDGKWIISLLRQGKFSEAKPLIRNFSKTYSDDKNYPALFVIEQGKYYKDKKEFGSAIKYFEEVKKKHKSSDYVDDADYNLALVYLTQNKNEDAFKILSNFYTNYPMSDQLPAALNSLGTLYYRSEKYDNAIKMFKNALTGCKDKELKKSILSNLIQTYTLTSFWDAAQASARQYVEEFPDADDNIDKKIIVAQAYINLNQFDNAIEYLRKIKFEADSEREPEIQFYIGEAYLKAGQYENAIAEFVKIPLLSKKTKLQWEASALYYSGQSYEKLGRIDDAIRMYREIIDRPGIDLVLKKDAEKRIQQIQ